MPNRYRGGKRKRFQISGWDTHNHDKENNRRERAVLKHELEQGEINKTPFKKKKDKKKTIKHLNDKLANVNADLKHSIGAARDHDERRKEEERKPLPPGLSYYSPMWRRWIKRSWKERRKVQAEIRELESAKRRKG